MFMRGPFMRYPFMETGTLAGDARIAAVVDSSASFTTSSSWDATLEEDNSPIVYQATIEPWVLADRS